MTPSGDHEPQETPRHTFTERILSTESQVSRFDRWIEFLSAAVLALATIATAWSAYQSTLWGGDEAAARAASGAAIIKSAQYAGAAVQIRSFQATLFVEWASAISQDNSELEDFLFQRFPPALKTATDAWIATEPLENPDAPSSPFVMPEYQLEENALAAQWNAEAAVKLEQANVADEVSDRYVLLTVLFASVLFFGGVAGKFQSQIIDLAMLIFAIIIFVVGLANVVTFPIQ
ncbi:MAG: hypothetical protein U9R25_20105 [Chloroflexota bacterium]|nr:hypothetical protein [Chloroflexota bacterium]